MVVFIIYSLLLDIQALIRKLVLILNKIILSIQQQDWIGVLIHAHVHLLLVSILIFN